MKSKRLYHGNWVWMEGVGLLKEIGEFGIRLKISDFIKLADYFEGFPKSEEYLRQLVHKDNQRGWPKYWRKKEDGTIYVDRDNIRDLTHPDEHSYWSSRMENPYNNEESCFDLDPRYKKYIEALSKRIEELRRRRAIKEARKEIREDRRYKEEREDCDKRNLPPRIRICRIAKR